MIYGYLLSFLIAFAFTYLLTPFVKKLALRFGALDHPDIRKVHRSPLPRWGGLALVPGIVAGILFAFFTSDVFREGLREIHRGEIWGIVGACSLMIAVGLVDDVRPVPAKLKLVAQIVASLGLIYSGVRISFFTNPLSHKLIFLSEEIAIPLSILWIIGITNALNLLDGLDGLLAGVSTIAGLSLFGIALQKGHIFSAFILIAMSGATLAFLRYNFNPAQIFLGDAGSLFLGILWASLSIVGAFKISAVTVVAPLLILGVPIADTAFTVFRRLGKGQSIFEPDKEHLHHRLLNLGWSQRKTVLTLYAISVVLGALAVFLNRRLP